MMAKGCFVEITNQDIYDEIIKLKDHVKTTNGKVKLNRWIASTALALSMMIFGAAMASAGVLI